MNVIIRLQNLPWSANALDIRQFFKGLSIPDGGVHIVGGEMGDAFIAFSTDEDARQAMMHDREAINGVQVRLLLSSRAEMQKVIETARQQSLRALQNASAVTAVLPPKVTPPPVVAPTMGTLTKPQPPVITANSLQCILSNSLTTMTPSFLAYQQQAGITLIPSSQNTKKSNDADDIFSSKHRESVLNSGERKSRSRSHSRERSSNRRRRDRSRERSRDREGKSYDRRRSRHSRDRSRDHDRSRSRSRDRSRERGRERVHERSRNSQQTKRDNKSRSHDTDNSKPKPQHNSGWSVPSKDGFETLNQNQTNVRDNRSSNRMADDSNPDSEGYNTKSKSLASMNNYSLNSFLNNSNGNRGFALQNPYTAALNTGSDLTSPNTVTTTSSSSIPGIFVEKKSDDTLASVSPNTTQVTLPHEPIVFADTNPYEKMYPNLFAQAAAIGTTGQKSLPNRNVESSPGSPKEEDLKFNESDPHKTRCIKILNMCPGTTYSDIRKFCVGLYIPHNGIKMVNDVHGLRVGVAYVQFSKQACVARALSRNNQILRNRTIVIEAVSEDEFESITDSFHPDNRDRPYSGSRGDCHSDAFDSRNVSSNPFKAQSTNEPFSVLYIEDIPALTTEQDIMKMFSSYTLYDILLLSSPENRREFVAHVRFSREEEAMSAFEDKAHLQIGYRRLRVRPGSVEEMDRAKEKIRQANEQLMKEEQAAAEEEDRNRKKEEAKINKQREIISLDLTQSDGDEDADGGGGDCIGDEECDDFIGNTNKLIDKVVSNDSNTNYYDGYDSYNDIQNQTDMDPRHENSGIPSLFDFDPMSSTSTTRVNDPRLRKAQRGVMHGTDTKFEGIGNKSTSNFNNFNPNFNDHQSSPLTVNNIEQNFVILKNCDYSTRISDVAQLLITANLALKHIEPLLNERQLPTGEFIVEFRKTQDTETAVTRFHNIQFMNRSLRVFPITPQAIADRLGKPFLSYIPGGNGIKVSDLKTLAAAMNVGNNMNPLLNNMEWNGNNNITARSGGASVHRFDTRDASNSNNSQCNMNDDNEDCTLPERFSRPGCVLELENVPYKAQLSDILNFFQGFDLKSEDIIRRFNDNGQPTGDARVAFDTPEDARKAFEARKRKQIFNRTIYLNIL